MLTIRLPTGEFEYDPLRPLAAAGGFGQVFFGHSASGEVAIKKLHLSAADAAHRELDVARDLKGTKFKHVVEIIDAGEDADSGGYFVVMPRAEFSLRQELKRRGKFAPAEAAAIMHEVVSGLAEVPHIIHRDLKPDNILWHEGRWKIADFGIARFVEDATSSQTLKGCLSPLYAAPEQWRNERATNATDIYALSCIGFELLAGAPPFATDPERQHQTEQLPTFPCGDARLSGLISLMARKPVNARPSALRTQTVLSQIAATPAPLPSNPLSDLADAGAKVAAAAQRDEAEKEAVARGKRSREQLHADAQEMLAENIGRLWEKIQANAVAAQRRSWQRNPCRAQIRLGNAELEIGRVICSMIPEGEFAKSGWDVVTGSTLTVTNAGRPYKWEVSLWYVKQSIASDYRWFEVGYAFNALVRQNGSWPFSANGFRDADWAASKTLHSVATVWGPSPIDTEDENTFHERCLWLFAKAAKGELRQPGSMPISSWPPQM